MLKKALIATLCVISVLLLGCGGAQVADLSEEQTDAGYRRTTLYYLSDDGYMVPVMKRIPWEEGIGRAALGYLVAGEGNDEAAAAMGLNTIIPAGTELTLSIDDGTATVDMIDLTAPKTPELERAMVTGIVNTLTEFPAIDRVRMTLNGKNAAALPHGTDISKAMDTYAMNVEEGSVPVSGDAKPVTLYFPNASASLNVPVTRYISAQPTIAGAVQELIAGNDDARLRSCFPDSTELLSAYISEGTAHIDLSREFTVCEGSEGLVEAALDTIYLTANEIEPVYSVTLSVEGEEYSRLDSSSAPIYINEFR